MIYLQVNLGRAARTDAGVHAAGNLVSLKMITAVPGVPDIVAHINAELPSEIRVWGYVGATHVIYITENQRFSRYECKTRSLLVCEFICT